MTIALFCLSALSVSILAVRYIGDRAVARHQVATRLDALINSR